MVSLTSRDQNMKKEGWSTVPQAAERLRKEGERGDTGFGRVRSLMTSTTGRKTWREQVLEREGIRACVSITLREEAEGHATPAPWPQMRGTEVDSLPKLNLLDRLRT